MIWVRMGALQWTAVCASAILGIIPEHGLTAQTDFYHTDAGRPIRVEDAIATTRNALDAQLAPLRAERTASGAERWRLEPKLSYGVFARTEVELRTSFAYFPRQGDASPARTGLSGVGVSVLHAFTLETPTRPAVALAADVVAPIGSLAAPRAAYSLKGMLTRSSRIARLHLNAALGTWSVTAPSTGPDTSCSTARFRPPGVPACGGSSPLPFPPDAPCFVGVVPGKDGPWLDRRASAMAQCDGPPVALGAPATAAVQPAPTSTHHGQRWFVGAALDHAFALHSVLLSADVYAERYVGLYDRTDWAAEVGARHQITPKIVLDAGVGRRFAGVNNATLATLGATLTTASPPLFR